MFSIKYVKTLLGEKRYNYYKKRTFIRETSKGVDWLFFQKCIKQVHPKEVVGFKKEV